MIKTSLSIVLACVFVALSSQSARAQNLAFGPGPSDSNLFDEVIEVAPAAHLNLQPQISTQYNLRDQEGSRIFVGVGLDDPTPELNMWSGSVSGIGSDGAEINILGGAVGSLGGGVSSTTNIYAGTIGSLASVPGEVNVFGGVIEEYVLLDYEVEMNVFGGSIDVPIIFFFESRLNLVGSDFRLNRHVIDTLVENEQVAVDLPGGAELSGTLTDGTSFSYTVDPPLVDLRDYPTFSDFPKGLYINDDSMVFLTLRTVPEPIAATLLNSALVCCLIGRRR